MKKLTYLWCAALALAFFFGSCQKEEDEQHETPQEVSKEKISKIWYAVEGTDSMFLDGKWEVVHHHTDRYLLEQWTWNGDKLTRIEHFSSDSSKERTSVDTFLYEGNKLTFAATKYFPSQKTYEYHFIYKEDKLSEIYFDCGTEYYDYKVLYEYSGNKISTVQVDAIAKGKKVSFPSLISRFFMPVCSEHVATTMEKSNTEGAYTHVFYVEWNGDNVSKTTRIFQHSPDEPLVTTYSYDNKRNPYFRLLTTPNTYDGIGFPMLSANNVLQRTIGDGLSTYTYTYQGQLPVRSVAHNRSIATGISPAVFDDFYTTEYEYQ